ncbi:MAG TPA: hypothetical protein VD816_16300 [Ohtaekwangia sp.]|nr:hypothetical protein [Ohtaekwangia sp.]
MITLSYYHSRHRASGNLSVGTLLFFLLILSPAWISAQTDTTKTGIGEKISQEVIRKVTRDDEDTITNIKSEQAFLRYNGKIIRHIRIRHTGFERSIYDSSRTIKNRITNLANSLHVNTRESVIRDNLFFHENKPLNPYLLADNERYLRDLDFILDSKIIVRRIKGVRDSVDIEVVTRDVFSLGVTGSARSIDAVTVGAYDANLLGMGQRLQVDAAFEVDRRPFTGFDIVYRKSSIGGTLINGSIGYTQIDNGRSIGEENEYAYFIRLDRPLVSPYSRLAGGLEISRNWSVNVFKSPDSLFRLYRYNVQDLWTGYNLGVKGVAKNRNRHFVAARYFRQHYSTQPARPEDQLRPIYNDQKFLLGELTFYKQNFYKTRYLYGFGRTEDVPYGHNIAFTAGWTEEFGVERTYVGASAVKGVVNKRGDFYEAETGFGTFYNKKKPEDTFLYLSALYYSKLMTIEGWKVRQLVRVGYAKAYDNRLRELLSLYNQLQGFRPDSLYGHQRIFLRTETTLFTDWRLVGFRFAPFLSLENAWLKPRDIRRGFGDFYWGTTGGIRIRNENLIFGTIELRALYFPNPPLGTDPVSFKVTTNVRLKYSGSFVRPPSLVRYNN